MIFLCCRGTGGLWDRINASRCTRAQSVVVTENEMHNSLLRTSFQLLQWKDSSFFLRCKHYKFCHETQKDKTLKNPVKLCDVYTYMCDTIKDPDPKEAKNHPQSRNTTTAL